MVALGCGTAESRDEQATGGRAGRGAGGAESAAGSGSTSTVVEPRRPFATTYAEYLSGSITPTGDPEERTAATTAAYDEWKARYVAPGCGAGRSVVLTSIDDDNLTLSEGIGYGLLATAYFSGHDPEAQEIFDGLYGVVRDHPTSASNYLMAWYLDLDCEPRFEGELAEVSSTDADLDVAYALLLADSQWGSCGAIDYRAEAERVIAAIGVHDVDPSEQFLLLGDWAEAAPWDDVMRSSDFVPGHLDAFAAATDAELWTDLNDALFASFALLQAERAPETGLFPDYLLDPTGTPAPATGGEFEAADAAYSWNACRLPWRLGVDALTRRDSQARDLLAPLTDWARDVTDGEPLHLRAGYTLDGEALPDSDFATMAFIAPLGVAALLDDEHRPWLDAIWEAVVAAEPEGYYEDSLRLLSMIAMSGHWWVPEANAEDCGLED